ncbi:MAG: CoA ester lyase [Zoogloeaceae bacterium]|jgi:citrate lyase subunit beta/citryl-CoA lyase|nr:CoA ester lyase [Zoogloeaceae bacterium]
MPTPEDILFAGEKIPSPLPAVDHYAGSEKLMLKALALQQEMGPIFDLTLDCEDGARVGNEAEHAKLCAELILSADNRFNRVGVRIHAVTHPHWQADLEIVLSLAGRRLPFITLPKARSAEEARRFLRRLRELEAAYGLTNAIPAHVLIETHGALREVWRIATLEGVESLDFGLMDFVSEHGGAIPAAAMQSPDQFTHPLIVRAKCEIAAAAHASGIVPTHNVCTELTNAAYIENDARRARQEFGYLRMWSIHPAQIAPLLAAFTPDAAEVETARALLAAAREANWGPIRYAGKLHDRASYRYYRRLLERADIHGQAGQSHECRHRTR